MKRFFITTIAFIGAALLLAGCDVLLGPNERAKTGSLVIGFGTEARAALSPAEKESLTYRLTLTGPGGQKIEANVSPGETFSQQVALGEWRIDAEARNPDDDLVGTGSVTVTVQTGTNQARVPMKTFSPEDTLPAKYREMALATPDAVKSVTITGNSAYGLGAFHLGRTVTLSPFEIAKYETTYELWHKVKSWAEGHGYSFANPGCEGNDGIAGAEPTEAGKLEPVTTISWRDAVAWCNAYSEMSGKEPVYYTDANYGAVLRVSTNVSGTGTKADRAVMKPGANGYRLPTEAEWEYAARGGKTPSLEGSFVYDYAGSGTAGDVAWYDDNAEDASHPVGRKAANTLGLYDMSGNVSEWCWDWHSLSIKMRPETNPAGPDSGSSRVIRGGSWVHGASLCAVTNRLSFYPPTAALHDYGFRVVCSADSALGPVAVTGVNLNTATLSLPVGGTATLAATVAPEDAANKSVTWASSDPAKATVSVAGLVTAVAAGTANITVTTEDGGKTASCVVTVIPASGSVAVTRVSLNTTALSIPVGGTATLTATVAPENAANKNVTWTSKLPAIATVSDTGQVTAVALGTATITVTTVSGGKTASCAVTVTPIAVTAVTLSKDTLSFNVGETATLVATVAPANATNKNVTWASSDPAKATVNAGGQLTALAAGTTTITATTADGGKKASCVVTVNAVPVTAVTLSKDTLSFNVGQTATLVATVAPANATNKNVTWVSSNPAKATVNAAGQVTAVALGTTTITATTADGGKTASCAVTVADLASSAQYREMALATPNATDSVTIEGKSAYAYKGSTTSTWKGVFIAGRTVTLNPFKIAKYETTYELWREVRQWARGHGYTFTNYPGQAGNDGTAGAVPGADKLEPVTDISWRDAIVWCNAYSEMSGKDPVYYLAGTTDFNDAAKVLRVSDAKTNIYPADTAPDKAVMNLDANGYRLPTEAEWEYAARGGGTPSATGSFAYKYAGADNLTDLKTHAWCSANAGGDTHPVGGKLPNTLGLYDMTGNVYEWCWDWHISDVGTGSVTDPAGPASPQSSPNRILRGGCYTDGDDSGNAVATRGSSHPSNSSLNRGFRVVCR